MEKLIGKMLLAYALYTLGMSLNDVWDCRSRQCLSKIETAKRKVLKIDWKPILIFPEEAKRFR